MNSKQPAAGANAISPTWTFVAGAISALMTLHFWVYALVPFVREKVPYPWWPIGMIVELAVATGLGVLAAVRGSKVWWLTVFLAVATLIFLVMLLPR